jgi:2-isopropylmalate synthase
MTTADVQIYDTTLRDGTQREGISLACSDKLRIAKELDALGVAFVEGGWPGSNPKDVELFRRARDEEWAHTTIAAFGSTRRAGIAPEDDTNLMALLESGARACTIFGKTSLLHVQEVLRTSADENLAMIEDSVRFLVASGRQVIYDAEHYFDGARLDEAYALATLEAAVRGGAHAVVLCDTNGGTTPWDVEAYVRKVVAAVPITVGIHAHDDTGCGVANSLAAVRAGAKHVQGTLNGYGERCGNANLTTIIPTLELKLGLRCLRPGALAELGRVARFAAETANMTFDEHAPYVGRSAFAHKGGVHVAAIRRSPRSYEHVDPALVGNRTRFVVSELSGRANVRALAESLDVASSDIEVDVLETVKEREARGFAFESAEASVALMMRRAQPDYVAPFELVDYKVLSGKSEPSADAAVKVRVRGELVHTAADGNGPVSALDAALRKALVGAFPEVEHIHLEDYKVRIIDGREGTAAITRVLIDHGYRHGNGHDRWTTVGASSSIIEASLVALVDGIEHGLWLARGKEEQDEGHNRLAAG